MEATLSDVLSKTESRARGSPSLEESESEKVSLRRKEAKKKSWESQKVSSKPRRGRLAKFDKGPKQVNQSCWQKIAGRLS